MAAASARRAPIDASAAWRSSDVADPTAWTLELDDAQREELARVARDAVSNGRSIATLSIEAQERHERIEKVSRDD